METAARTRTDWRIVGEETGSCNCAWGCPCQFNSLPTYGRCEALVGLQIREGYFGDTRLDGVRFASIFSWPGPIHEGNGYRQLIIDERATQEQRDALIAMTSGTQGGTVFEIFAAVCPNVLEPIIAPISLESDRERRQATLHIPAVGEFRIEPIKNPATGEDIEPGSSYPRASNTKKPRWATRFTCVFSPTRGWPSSMRTAMPN